MILERLHLNSLKTRVTLFTLAIFLICLWSLEFYAERALHKELEQQLAKQQFSTVSVVGAQLKEELEFRLKGLETIAENISPALMANTQSLQLMLSNRPVFQKLFNGGTFVTAADGTAIVSLPVSAGRVGVNYMERDHIAAALKDGKSRISKAVIGKKLLSPVVSMAVPVRGAQGKVIGALVGVTDLAQPNFLDRITSHKYGETGGFYITSRQYRTIVTASDKTRIMELLPASGISPALDRFIQGHEGTEIFVNPRGVEVFATAISIPVADWYLAAVLPTLEAFYPIHKLLQELLLVTVALTLLAGGLTWWVLRRQLSPLLDTAQRLSVMSQAGQVLQILPVSRRGEIGDLISGFNRLVVKLMQREEENQALSKMYKALSQCNQAIVRSKNEAELLPQICRDVVQFGGMKMAWIGMLDEKTKHVKPVASFGEGIAYLDGIEISVNGNEPSGQGPTGTSMREIRPYWCQNFQSDPLTSAWHERGAQFGWGASASIPLLRKGVVVGAFTVYAGKVNAFTEDVQKLLLEMAVDVSFSLNRFSDEAELNKSQILVKMAGELAKIGAWEVQLPEMRIIWSDEVCRIHEMPLGTRPTLEQGVLFYAPEYLDRIKEVVGKAISDGTSFDEELQIITATGKRLWVRSIARAVRNSNGDITSIQGAFQDISANKKAISSLLESETRHRKLLFNLHTAVVVHAADSSIIFNNQHASELLGLSEEQLNGKAAIDPAWHFMDEFGNAMMVDDYPVSRVISTLLPVNDQVLGIHNPGRADVSWVMAGAFPEFDTDGKLQQIVVNFHDITELKNAQGSLNKLSLAVEQSPNSIVITNLEANIEYANAAFTKITGYSLEDVIGKNPRFMQSGKTFKSTYDSMWANLSRGDVWKGELRNRRKDGSEYTESAIISPVRQANGKITHYLAIKEDITQKKADEEHIDKLAHFDQLTGLPNRILLQDRFKFSLSLAQRNNENLALMFLDLDHFKNINDTLGHSVGDLLLMEIGKRIKELVRAEDTVSRQGGDEFVLILPGTDADGAALVATKLMEVISQPVLLSQHELIITASIGIAIYPDDGESLEILSKNADVAMYRVKQDARNGFQFFTQEMQKNSARTLRLSLALRHALARNELQLHYQPQISIEDGHVVGAEALLRWRHPELGMISPAEFIPIAEDSGQIIPIGEWVLRSAAQQLKKWLDSGLPPMVVAVNLSAVQFRQSNIAELIIRIVDEEKLPHEYLEVELTEAATMHDPQSAIAVMDSLHELGIRMSIDDFGTGYSSLSYLKKFKVYKLKIDQSFVRNLSEDQDDKAIVTTIINLATSLGLHTIAEGVETASQLAFLRLHGCDEVQGYYFSKPLPVDEFERFLKKSIAAAPTS